MIKRLVTCVALLGILGVLALASGCGSLSLFSSRHVHYHASPDADKKIDSLEKRVEVLEKTVQAQQKQ